ncbi:MAG: glycosyl transferase family 90 [Flavobacteriales bacterium]|nr:glycosyl transferase family 90 [Flavobacteriales bacterium]
MKNLPYYVKNFTYNTLPKSFFRLKFNRLRTLEQYLDTSIINSRLNYYFKRKGTFEIPENTPLIKDFKRTKGSGYYLDLKEFLHYFNSHVKLAYHFGDETHVNDYPTLFKARPISGDNRNSILFKLNKYRHFKWVDDPFEFSEKKDVLVWRGGAYKSLRRDFVKKYWNHPLCDVGQTNKPAERDSWQKEYLSVKQQLQYKFIFCPEGNDVATNLKWVMSSNSLCMMPKPKYETWFMEGTLEPGVHYVEIDDDFRNLEQQIRYYSEHMSEAQEIIKNANAYVKQFQNKDMEDYLCFKVLERYASLSGQKHAIRFGE